jgi:WASH complex subunit strumpellin
MTGFYVELECNQLLRHPISEDESIYQSQLIPIPKFNSFAGGASDGKPVTCIGRLLNRLLEHTSPRTGVYSSELNTWFDARTKTQRLAPTDFDTLLSE